MTNESAIEILEAPKTFSTAYVAKIVVKVCVMFHPGK